MIKKNFQLTNIAPQINSFQKHSVIPIAVLSTDITHRYHPSIDLIGSRKCELESILLVVIVRTVRGGVEEVGEFEFTREEGEPRTDWNLRAFGAKRRFYEIANKTNIV